MSGLFKDFAGHNRFSFPEGLVRVTSGKGGEAILLNGFEKTALIDCGMAYCADKTILNIKNALNGRNLDYILITHSHYDHIGALSQIKEAFKEANVCASMKAAKVFSSEGAKKVMKKLSNEARILYSDIKEEIEIGDMSVDIILKDGDFVDLGNGKVISLETKGHTDCCLTYIIRPLDIMLTSESTGVLESENVVHSSILKSYEECEKSCFKCMNQDVKHIIIPHYGIIPESFNKEYFRLFLKQIKEEKTLIQDAFDRGLTDEDVLEIYKEKYWKEEREREQPLEAFLTNAKVTVQVLKKRPTC